MTAQEKSKPKKTKVRLGESRIVTLEQLDELLAELKREGHQLIGPTVSDEAVVLDEISSVRDLPAGYTDKQDAASYRLTRSESAALFNFNTSLQSWKRFLYPPRLVISEFKRGRDGFEPVKASDAVPKLAFIGVRACDLHAIRILDRVLIDTPYPDLTYANRRKNTFLCAVNCSKGGGTCFCASMGTGPRATDGYDLAMTEVLTDDTHYFVIDAGSSAGVSILNRVTSSPATKQHQEAASAVTAEATRQMGRTLDTADIKEVLQRNLDNLRWEKTARRCLSCTNCTMVCPTCFCTTVDDYTDLTGTRATRVRRWDSCFTMEYSYIHGGSVRPSVMARYRQWMTHKLANWIDQFGTSGCVGCGRCITWCPVGIDITEEARVIRESDMAQRQTSQKQEAASAGS